MSKTAVDKLPLPVVTPPLPGRTRMSRRRAWALAIVHLLIAAHILHWWISGATLTPLEPSEAGYTIASGAINAGAIFFCVLILSTVLLGRFFCGWACHVVAYQDAARWVLLKLGIHPQPLRSRVLMLVPIFAALWLYGRPALSRWRSETPVNTSLHLVTEDFWATFPGPGIALLTLLICGPIIVYFLGAKGFCTYGCPYGAFFGAADRLARGRIRVTSDCDGSAQCTLHCSSNVDVAEEVRRYGMVVNPGCLKCMDCISVCPNGALYYGFRSRTSPRRRDRRKDRPPRRDHGWVAELLLGAAFVVSFWVFYNLYRVVPFLLAVGLSVISAGILISAGRLLLGAKISLQNLSLDWSTRRGRLFAGGAAALLLFLIYGGVVQYHTRRGTTLFEQVHASERRDSSESSELAARSRRHLQFAAAWSPIHPRGVGRMLGNLALWDRDADRAVTWLEREIQADTRNPMVLVLLGHAQRARGDTAAAVASYRRAPQETSTSPRRHRQLAAELGRQGEFLAQREVLAGSLEQYPREGDVALDLCVVLLRCPDPTLRDPPRALEIAATTCEHNDRSHADLLAMLAYLYSRSGQPQRALKAGLESLELARRQGLTEIAEQMSAVVEDYRRDLAAARDRGRPPDPPSPSRPGAGD